VLFRGAQSRRPIGWQPLFTVLTLAILGAAIYYFARGYSSQAGISSLSDFVLYRDAAGRWLAVGQFYLPHQLEGAYAVSIGDVLYPPPILVLLVPIAILPLPLAALTWWAVPAGLIAASLWRLRPAAWSWPLLALTLWWPSTLDRIATGNPLIWIVAALYVTAVIPGPSVLVLLKPTLAPFAFFRANSRRWGIAAGALVVVSLLFGPLWFDYARVIANARSFAGPGYSIEEFPALTGALVAFVARQRGDRGIVDPPDEVKVDGA
jgi:hypothetical protein